MKHWPARRHALALCTVLPALLRVSDASAQVLESAPPYVEREAVQRFIERMVAQHGFEAGALATVFRAARGSSQVAQLIQPPPPGFRRSWKAYRARFVEPVRIREGLAFWQQHRSAVLRAAATYGVRPEYMVAIIGVETVYGRDTGSFRVIDALSTLSFDVPRRADYFQEELEQYLLLAREQRFDPLEARGSFAGAMGLPQFMPGSIRRHAVDFDGDGRIDLHRSPADAVGSVGRFLANHGWEPDGPTHYPARVENPERAAAVLGSGSPPEWTAADLAQHGVSSTRPLPADRKLYLVDLQRGDGTTQYVLGAQNFYVITRYNRSFFYAMAVIELAEALRQAASQAVKR